jgi:hypothetical protein
MNTQHDNLGACAFSLVIVSGFSFHECKLLFLSDKCCKMSKVEEQGLPAYNLININPSLLELCDSLRISFV